MKQKLKVHLVKPQGALVYQPSQPSQAPAGHWGQHSPSQKLKSHLPVLRNLVESEGDLGSKVPQGLWKMLLLDLQGFYELKQQGLAVTREAHAAFLRAR